ncbi:FAD/NAD(P)-binding domain-containing protein [Gymnopus androsaceus JB14]|uniref:FAD/NAD(P)-binding domain-containing protein n=1 Tax=Gymnopus androsaceus JB14 TaxID=1447944 RepID=A0A6A4GCN3_9AGAR|nr:FAD/NAD(P)-binding domain-containing protein [Gymnopus androsaceus JB14]
MSSLIPTKTTVLVVGGGPAGSYAASVLARRQIDVVVLDAAKFPRYHIGESLLASTNYFLEYIGAREKVLAHGFIRKPGGAFKFRKDFPAVYTNFVEHNNGNHAFNVNRAEYDELLFRHAGEQGAKIFDEHKVTQIRFSEQDSRRPIAAEWESVNGNRGTVEFDYLIDAAGRQGLLSTKYHKDREFTQSLKNSAVWAYWKGSKRYGEGTERLGAAFAEALHDHTGWCWYLPINDGSVSIGFVIHEEFMKGKRAGKTLEEFYMSQFELLTDIPMYRGEGVMIPNKEGRDSLVYMASDYSYAAEDVGRLNYRIVGDSAAFIDPFFSSGVHLASVGSLSAAISIISVIDGKVSEETAAEFHDAELKMAFHKMRGGLKTNVLNDIDEESFDRAFDIIRPVIQGTGDIGVDKSNTGNVDLSEEEVRSTMDFIFRLFSHAPPGAKVVDHEDDGLHGNVDDLDRDARARLKTFSQYVPNLMGHDGVMHILDAAQRKMNFSAGSTTKTELKAIVPVV